MENDKKIIACVDQSRYASPVADYAAWASRVTQAPLTLLHVLDRHPERGPGDDHSGAIGVDAQENLVAKLAADEAARTAAAREQGRIFLDGLRERVQGTGVTSVEVRQRHGALEETLAEQEPDVRLLVLGHAGAAGGANGSLGGQVERVVRALHVPVLIVPDAFKAPQRALIAFDGGHAARRAVDMVAASPLFESMASCLFMAGKANGDALGQLDWAEGVLRGAGRAVQRIQKPGDVAGSILATLDEESIDLLVMGAFGHSALRSLVFGSKTAELLRAVRVPALLLR